MSAIKIELQRGVALVLEGGPGTRKTMFAEALAAPYGAFAHVSARDIAIDGVLGNFLLTGVKTLIVDGVPSTKMDIQAIKNIISKETLLVDVLFGSVVTVKTPNFIFCTGDSDPLRMSNDDRRFFIVNVEQQGAMS